MPEFNIRQVFTNDVPPSSTVLSGIVTSDTKVAILQLEIAAAVGTAVWVGTEVTAGVSVSVSVGVGVSVVIGVPVICKRAFCVDSAWIV